ncbi:MAG TPA: hypothetical protein VFV69_17490 [Steroidobacteraceae bacterium]|jgi:hypothetical protein|nr:hypothetical protein [Steroidobacteraceae bacterium]
MTAAVRHLQQLDALINRVVREADLIHDYVQLRFHGGLVLTLNNAVELAGQLLANSPAGRIALASIVGRAVNDVERAADQIVVNFRGGSALTMSLHASDCHSREALTLTRSPAPPMVAQ